MLNLKYTGRLIKKRRWVVAYCPELDLYSQGDDEEEARRNLDEAVRLFLEEIAQMGTLEQVLDESGYKLVCTKRRPRRTTSTFEKEVEVGGVLLE